MDDFVSSRKQNEVYRHKHVNAISIGLILGFCFLTFFSKIVIIYITSIKCMIHMLCFNSDLAVLWMTICFTLVTNLVILHDAQCFPQTCPFHCLKSAESDSHILLWQRGFYWTSCFVPRCDSHPYLVTTIYPIKCMQCPEMPSIIITY